MKVVYVAGPYSTDNKAQQAQFMQQAKDATLVLWTNGIAGLCPLTMTEHFASLLSWERFLETDCELLKRCDGVLFLPGWEKSKGCQEEWRLAVAKHKDIFYTIDELVFVWGQCS